MAIETGIYRGDDDRLYFVALHDGHFFALGEDLDASAVTALAGELREDGREITGTWADLPKGTRRNAGRFRLEATDEGFQAVDLDGDLGAGNWIWMDFRPDPDSFCSGELHRPGFGPSEGGLCRDLSGLWLADDGASVYVARVGDTVFWYHEHPDVCAEDPGTSADMATLFVGDVDTTDCGTMLRGRWGSLPKGRQEEEGVPKFGTQIWHVIGGGELSLWEADSGYRHSGRELRRVAVEMIEIDVSAVRVDRSVPAIINPGDDIFITFCLVIADSTHVDARNPGASHVRSEARWQFLRKNVRDGQSAAVSNELGRFRFLMAEWIGGWPPQRFMGASFAFGAIGFEQDRERNMSRDVSVWTRPLGARWGRSPAPVLSLGARFIPPPPGDSGPGRTIPARQTYYHEIAERADSMLQRGRLPAVRGPAHGSHVQQLVGWTQRRFRYGEELPRGVVEAPMTLPGHTDDDPMWTAFVEFRRLSARRLSDLG